MFKQFGLPKKDWAYDRVLLESILLEVKLADLTAGGQNHQLEKPVITKEFMDKVRWFVDLHHDPVENVLVADEEQQPTDPKGLAGPKAHPTSSSRCDAAAGARPAHSMPEGRATPAVSA